MKDYIGMIESIGTELYSLGRSLKKGRRKTLEKIMSSLLKKAQKGFCNVNVVYELSKKKTILNPQESSMVKLFLYLVLVEGPALCVVDVLVILLILNDHPLEISKNKFAKPKIEDLEDVKLYRKLEFLGKNGFPSIPIAIDRDLRNDIAHHDFSLDKKGVIWINGKTVDMDSKIDNAYIMGRILSNFYDLIILKQRPEDEFLEVLKSIANQ